MSKIQVDDAELINIFFHSISPGWVRRDDETIKQCIKMMRGAIAAAEVCARSQKLRDAGYTRRPTWKSLPSDE
jgi:hypothetical protein